MKRLETGAVAMTDSVGTSAPTSGQTLRAAYVDSIRALTLGLIRMREGSLWLGPLELLRFGRADLKAASVEWPIEGGLLARQPGGRFRIAAGGAQVVATVEGYQPTLPFPLFELTQMPVHHALTRLYLLRVRGREPGPIGPAATRDRRQAAAIDIAFCGAVAALSGRRPRARVLLGVAVVYHLTCWTVTGRTLGGLVTRQRVVSVDGSRATFGQALARLLALPLAWVRNTPVHDELAGTEIVND